MANPPRPRHLVWTAELPPAAVRDRLRAATGPRPTVTVPSPVRFWGRVDDASFDLRLAENRRNSLYAVISGTIAPFATSTRISARLRLPVGPSSSRRFFSPR